MLLTRLVQPRDNDSVSLEPKLEAVRGPRRGAEENRAAILQVEYARVTRTGKDRARRLKGRFPQNLNRIREQIHEAFLMRADAADDG